MSNEGLRNCLWWLCLIVAPLVLCVIELFHPAGFTRDPGAYEYLSKAQPYDPRFEALAYWGPEWWFRLHMIQTPLVALVGVGLWLTAGRVDRHDGTPAVALVWLSRAATFVFMIYYSALDSIGGFGLARAILNTQSLEVQGKLTREQVEGARLLLDTNWTDPWVGGVGSFVSLTGSWAVFAAALALALALGLAAKARWWTLLLLVGFGWELQLSHTMPHGPIAFVLLIAAALSMRLADRRTEPAG